jgi:hypothetical protein
MSIVNNSNNQWSDPKDYGLPVIEIKPIRPLPESISQEEVPESQLESQSSPEVSTENVIASSSIVEELRSEEDVPNPIVQSIIAERILESKKQKSSKPALNKKSVPTATPDKKSSKSWIGITLFISAIIIAIIIWQMTIGSKSLDTKSPLAKESSQPISNTEESTGIVNDPKDSEIQIPENQDNVTQSISSAESPIQKPESGTTIDRTVKGTLIRVESKAESPTYFIVVGSLPSERLALEEAIQYQNRVSSVYLISPYDDNKNYRLAIASFKSFNQANEELERIKADYTEALWILKY